MISNSTLSNISNNSFCEYFVLLFQLFVFFPLRFLESHAEKSTLYEFTILSNPTNLYYARTMLVFCPPICHSLG